MVFLHGDNGIYQIYMYGISDDCSSECVTNNEDNNIGQCMTGNFYLCAWITKGDCDMDADTYEDYQCSHITASVDCMMIIFNIQVIMII